MVYFELFYRSELLLKYHYWPENNRNSEPGIVVVELNTGNIYIEKIAALNSKRLISVEEVNRMVDSINEDILARGGTNLEKYIDHDLISYFYGNHFLSALQDAFDEGKVLENDTRAWY